LGGSYARSRALPASDIDLGVFYSDKSTAVEKIAQLVHETVPLADGLYKPRYTLPGL